MTSFEAGQGSLARPSSLLRFQQEAGERHLGEAGLTYQEFYRRGMIFVLTRLNVEIHRLPAMGEEVSLLTCIGTARERSFTAVISCWTEEGRF